MERFKYPDAIPDYHAVYTIQLCELINGNVLDWNEKPLANCFDDLDAIDANIKTRLKDMFEQRNYWREISIVPYFEWAQTLAYKIKFELVPKYAPLYKAIAEGDFNPTQSDSEYFKERRIDSSFPETLLSGNGADYASSGNDREYQRINMNAPMNIATQYYNSYIDIDTAFVNELDSMLIDLETANVNVW